MKRKQRFAAVLLVVFAICSGAAAQEKEIQRELIGWPDLRAIEFAKPSWRQPVPSGKKLASVMAALEKQRTEAAKAIIGREFYGMCEIRKIRPHRSKVKSLEFVLYQRVRLDDPDSTIGAHIPDGGGGAYLMQIVIVVPMDEARAYAVGDVVNLSGKVKRFSFSDWHNLFMGGDGFDPIISVWLEDAEL